MGCGLMNGNSFSDTYFLILSINSSMTLFIQSYNAPRNRFKDRKEKRKVMSVKHEKRHKLLTTSDGINEPYKEKKYGDIPQKLKIQQKKPLKMCERELIGGDEQTCNNEIRVQQDKDDEKSDVIKVVVEEKIKRINPFDEQTKTTKKQKVCQKELEEDEDTIQVNKKLLSGVVGIVEGNKRRTKKTNSDITTFTPKSLDAKNVEDIIGGWD